MTQLNYHVEFKKHARAAIYQKPLTCEDFEGWATLRKEYRPDEGDGIAMWEVEFDDEPGRTFLRTVMLEHVS